MGRSATWALIAACALSACASAEPQGGAPSSTPPRATSTTFDRAAEEAAVIAAYLAEIDAFLDAADPPDPDDRRLAEVATGPQLEGARNLLIQLQRDGIAIRPGTDSTHTPKVTRLTTTAAVVEDCVTDADIKVDAITGEIVDDSVVAGVFTARLIKRDQRWLVEDSVFDEKPCAQ